MKKSLTLLMASMALVLLAACGDETTTEIVAQAGQNYVEIVDAESDLPECADDNEGALVLVKGESYARTCVDGGWTSAVVAGKDTLNLKGDKVVCTTKELDDKSGIKIVCNGDSVGVLLNGGSGAKGEKGGAGAGCVIQRADSVSVRLYCGADSTMVYLGVKPDTTSPVIEPPKVVVVLDSLTGFAQKGPFLKGGKVTLYELRDSVTLEKTGRSYIGEVLNDSGYYKILNVELSSRYAIVTAKGFYFSETSSDNPSEPVELNALVDLLERKTVNVNLLTHFEAERVKNLVQHKKMDVQSAKRQARNEIVNQFHVDTVEIISPFEDMNILGSTDADAFLLAMSIIISDNGNEPLLKILPEISNDMFRNGEWGNLEYRANVSDRFFFMDMMGMTQQFRGYMEYWNIPVTAPDYEKYLRIFWSVENGLGVCGSDSVPLATVKHVSNKNSMFYARNYTDTTSRGGKNRFICSKADVAKWFFASDIEKDTVGLNFKNNKTGVTVVGMVTGGQILWDDDNLRHATENEEEVSWGCIRELEGQCVGKASGLQRHCLDKGMGKYCFIDARDSNIYEYVKIVAGYIDTAMWMSENLKYGDSVKTPSLKGKTFCFDDDLANCEKTGPLYTWAAAIDSVRLATDPDNPKKCGYGEDQCIFSKNEQGICPDGWHLPKEADWSLLYRSVGENAGEALKSQSGWNTANGGFNANGSDRVGFNGYPGGFMKDNGKYFYYRGDASYWSAIDSSGKETKMIRLDSIQVFVKESYLLKTWGASIRCVKNM